MISPRDYCIKIADNMSKWWFTLTNWIYFWLRENKEKRNGFTIGLKIWFNEIEFSDSDKSFDEIYKILYDLAHHVLLSRQPLKKGNFWFIYNRKNSLEPKAGEFRDTESMHVVVMKI